MIYKKTLSEDKQELYIHCIDLAFHGKTEELRKEIANGAPIMGLTPELITHSMEFTPELITHSDDLPYYLLSNLPYVYTTVEAAVLEGQYETLCMLIEEGEKQHTNVFDLRNSYLQYIILYCRDERIVSLARSKSEYHFEELLDVPPDRLIQDNEVMMSALHKIGYFGDMDADGNYEPKYDLEEQEDLIWQL